MGASITFERQWDVPTEAQTYFCSVGDLTRDPYDEIVTLDFDENLIAYNSAGNKIFEMPFSSEVTALFVGDVFQDGRKIFVSMDLNGYVRLFSLQGEEIWKVQLHDAVVTGAIGNLDIDEKMEIACILENNEIIILDDDGHVLLSYQHPHRVLSCTVGAFRDPDVTEIIFADTSDQIYFLDVKNSLRTMDLAVPRILGLDRFHVNGRDLLAVQSQDTAVAILDATGSVLGTLETRQRIQHFSAGSLFANDTDGLMVELDGGGILAYKATVRGAGPDQDSTDAATATAALPVPEPTPTPREERVVLEFDQKTRLFGMIKVEKKIDLAEAKDMVGVNKHDIKGLIYDLVGEGKIEGEFHDDTFVITSNVDDFIAQLDDSFADWAATKGGKV